MCSPLFAGLSVRSNTLVWKLWHSLAFSSHHGPPHPHNETARVGQPWDIRAFVGMTRLCIQIFLPTQDCQILTTALGCGAR